MRDVSSPPHSLVERPSGSPPEAAGAPSANGSQSNGPPVLVTGAAGFIGAAVIRELVRAGQNVLGVDDLSAGFAQRLEGLDGPGHFQLEVGDIRDQRVLDRLLGRRPSVVLHLAARVGVRTVLEDPRGCEKENLDGARALRSALDRLAEVSGGSGCLPRVIAASTSEVYAEAKTALGEDSALRPRVASGRWRYAASKRLAEEILDRGIHAGEAGGPSAATHLRFFNVVGPGQDASSGMVLPRFVEAARAGKPIEVYGTGRQVRTFAHVNAVAKDVAALVIRSAAGDSREPCGPLNICGPLNLGGSATATIAELASLVARIYGECVPSDSPVRIVQRDPKRAVASNFEEVFSRTPDLSRLRALGLGEAPWTLADIVRDTVEHHTAPGYTQGAMLDTTMAVPSDAAASDAAAPASAEGASRIPAGSPLCASRAS